MCCRLFLLALIGVGLIVGSPARAIAAGSFQLSVPQDLRDSGFLKYLLPRFSLKTNTRIELVDAGTPADADLSDGADGTPVFEGLGKVWVLAVKVDAPGVVRFEEWLTGDVGRRTIDGFPAKNGVSFAAAAARAVEVDPGLIAGDAGRGEKLAVLHCGRCHRVNAAKRISGIGSTPSFAIMRSFADWQARFEGFFAINPHPSFTVIKDVTEPFDETRPPAIVPVEMTMGELDAIMAFVSRIPPADLGAPLKVQ
ncbi:cytochrome c [Labrenzia sp. PHM005]|nr:cytochrome c [Labrenzia sp. PHM005]